MAKRIDSLTQEQRDQMPGWVEKWVKIGLCCDEADWATSAKAIDECYGFAGLQPPKKYIKVKSPIAVAMAAPAAIHIANQLETYEKSINSAVSGKLRELEAELTGLSLEEAALRIMEICNPEIIVCTGQGVNTLFSDYIAHLIAGMTAHLNSSSLTAEIFRATMEGVCSATIPFLELPQEVLESLRKFGTVATPPVQKSGGKNDGHHDKLFHELAAKFDPRVPSVGQIQDALSDVAGVRRDVHNGAVAEFDAGNPLVTSSLPPVEMEIEANPSLLEYLVIHCVKETLDTMGILKLPELWEYVKANYGRYLGGTFWVSWQAYESFFFDVCGLEVEGDIQQRAESYRAAQSSSGWWYPTTDFVMVSDRPDHIDMEDGVLHSASRLAIQWRDGWGLAFWRGVKIPESWVLEGLPSAQEILQIENLEVRRCGCEMVGWGAILDEVGAVLIDKDPDPMIGELYEAVIPDSGKERFLKVLCGTGRTFTLGVEPTCQTAREANASTYGMSPEEFNVEVRT